jgi:hypothetical protein
MVADHGVFAKLSPANEISPNFFTISAARGLRIGLV